MNTKHEKSPCCRGSIIHFGKRRRQCTICQKTWRVWRRQRGRKKKRYNTLLVHQYLGGNFVSCAKEARKRNILESTFRKRLQQSTRHFVATTSWKSVSAKGPYIVTADAVIKRIKHQWYTIYAVAIKHPQQSSAILLPPIILNGRETYHGWEKVFDMIPVCTCSPRFLCKSSFLYKNLSDLSIFNFHLKWGRISGSIKIFPLLTKEGGRGRCEHSL